MGGVPREVTSLISPGIDVTQFLLLNREVVQADSTFNGIGTFLLTELTVPAGELWYVHAAQVRTTVAGLPAGASCRIAATINLANTRIMRSDPNSAVAGEIANAFCHDFWIPAGGGIGLRVLQYTSGAPLDWTGGAHITRLRI